MRRVTDMVPRDAPDHLLRLAMLFCGRCNMDDQFALGIDLMTAESTPGTATPAADPGLACRCGHAAGFGACQAASECGAIDAGSLRT
jgi:hypothetical protein